MRDDLTTELDERKAQILRAVVEEYIETAQPVGSGHVAKAASVQVSPATIRNDMATLEQDGFLFQPHTSAGRIPTEKGYRFFVDSMEGSGQLGNSQAQQVRSFFETAHGEIEQMLRSTSQLLSSLTSYTSVVVAPPHEVATIRSVQLVRLNGPVALLVVVLSNGAVDKHTIDIASDTDDSKVAIAGGHLVGLLLGRSVSQPTTDLLPPATGDPEVDAVIASALEVIAIEVDEPGVYIGGASNTAAAFDAVGTVREVLRILEQQLVVVTLMRDVVDRGLSVAIGTEMRMAPLSECAVVVAPYEVDGEPAGSIGLLGPTRMNYPQALAAVAVVSKRLGNRLSEG
jgi:heat-inducible transcriptional repressor